MEDELTTEASDEVDDKDAVEEEEPGAGGTAEGEEEIEAAESEEVEEAAEIGTEVFEADAVL